MPAVVGVPLTKASLPSKSTVSPGGRLVLAKLLGFSLRFKVSLQLELKLNLKSSIALPRVMVCDAFPLVIWPPIAQASMGSEVSS